jgi:dUTP pyrophosphatase
VRPARDCFTLQMLRIKLLYTDSKVPTRGSAGAAGYDVCSYISAIIPPGKRYLVPTGVAVAIPEDCYLRIAPRSGLAWKKEIDIGAGVCDLDYRGEIGVLLINNGTEPFRVEKGDRIAQAILEKICIPEVVIVDDLDNTVRGSSGFGSTGV